MDFIHIWDDGRYRSKDFISTIPILGVAWGQGHGQNFHKKSHLFVCVEVLRPNQPSGVMSSAVSLPNHTFTGQA